MLFFGKRAKSGLTAQEAVTGSRDGTVIVVDVRDRGELATSGKAEGALHVPLTRLADMADPRHPDYQPNLKPEAKIAIYCASGGRSGMAAATLRRMGYSDVHNIGGLGHWVQAGGGIERP